MVAGRRLLGGHLGSSVSALLDGQLDPEATERAWQHVLSCRPCRQLVEHEGWVKRQLAQISDVDRPEAPSDQLVGSLLDLHPETVDWGDPPDVDRSSRNRRRAGIALVGAGSVSAAVFGLSTLGASPMGIGGSHNTPAGSIGGGTSRPTSGQVSPAASLQGRTPGWLLGRGQDDIGHTHVSRRHR